MEKVHRQLYISDLNTVKDLDRITDLGDIDYVINVSGEKNAPHDTYYPLKDGEMEDQKRFDGAVENVLQHLEQGFTVLIYCAAGVSRSVGVAATALAEYEKTNWVDSFQQIKEKRPIANPHPGIRKHGRKYLGEELI